MTELLCEAGATCSLGVASGMGTSSAALNPAAETKRATTQTQKVDTAKSNLRRKEVVNMSVSCS